MLRICIVHLSLKESRVTKERYLFNWVTCNIYKEKKRWYNGNLSLHIDECEDNGSYADLRYLLEVTQPIISLCHTTNTYESHFDESGC